MSETLVILGTTKFTAKIAANKTLVVKVASGTAPASNANYINVTAGEPLGGNRAVALSEDGKAIYADRADTSQAQKVLGITTGAIAEDATGKVQTSGEMTEPSWNWDVTKPVFLSTLGNLTQTGPTSGFLLQIGIPTAATKLLITLKQDFILL